MSLIPLLGKVSFLPFCYLLPALTIWDLFPYPSTAFAANSMSLKGGAEVGAISLWILIFSGLSGLLRAGQ